MVKLPEKNPVPLSAKNSCPLLASLLPLDSNSALLAVTVIGIGLRTFVEVLEHIPSQSPVFLAGSVRRAVRASSSEVTREGDY